MPRVLLAALAVIAVFAAQPCGAADSDAVKKIVIHANRDIGYFVGDLVKADVDIVVAGGYDLKEASLPHPGPVTYWLDLRKVDVVSHSLSGGAHRYTLRLLYQDFYEALDARQQEIPTFAVTLADGAHEVTANVPAWTIGVSPLREIAPPPKNDPKDYLRADESARPLDTSLWWWSAAGTALAALLSVAVLAFDRAWWPFHPRPARVFTDAVRRLKPLSSRADSTDAYLEALLVLHRGIDQADGQRVLADDLPAFLDRHPIFESMRDPFARFFAASRAAFFRSDPAAARSTFGFAPLQTFARQLAAIERSQS